MGLDNSHKSPHDLGELHLNSFSLLLIWLSAYQETLIINLNSYIPDLLGTWLPIKAYSHWILIRTLSLDGLCLEFGWLSRSLNLLISGKNQIPRYGASKAEVQALAPRLHQGDAPRRVTDSCPGQQVPIVPCGNVRFESNHSSM